MTQPVPDTCSGLISPQTARNVRLNARRRQETIARREKERGVALPVSSRVPSVSPELREEIRRRVLAEGGGPGDIPLIIMEAGWLCEDPTSPWFGDQRIALCRLERFAVSFSRSWREAQKPNSRVRPAKRLKWVEPNIRHVEVVSAIRLPGRTTASFEARARFGGLGLVARSFWSLDVARGWLRAARQAHAEGKDPREVVTMFYKWGELEALGRVQAA